MKKINFNILYTYIEMCMCIITYMLIKTTLSICLWVDCLCNAISKKIHSTFRSSENAWYHFIDYICFGFGCFVIMTNNPETCNVSADQSHDKFTNHYFLLVCHWNKPCPGTARHNLSVDETFIMLYLFVARQHSGNALIVFFLLYFSFLQYALNKWIYNILICKH